VFGQTFSTQDIAVIALLILLEGVLSIDNALVLALLAKPLPPHLRTRALTYGLVGAFIFRFIAVGTASYLLKWRIVKLAGGAYLLWIALRHLFSKKSDDQHLNGGPDDESTLAGDATSGESIAQHPGFWHTVAVIELTDIAFAVDSILAAIAVVGSAPVGHVGPHPKLCVVITGGLLGVILMRVAAALFIRLLERFPRFETSAYLLVAVIGAKLVIDWGANTDEHPHRINFHDTGSPEFWIFWALMVVCIALGFLPDRRKVDSAPPA